MDNHVAPPSYTVTLTDQELGLVIAGLYELPMKFSAGLAAKLQQLRQPQSQKQESGAC